MKKRLVAIYLLLIPVLVLAQSASKAEKAFAEAHHSTLNSFKTTFAAKLNICQGDSSFFYGRSEDPIRSRHWNFGDGEGSSSTQNPIFRHRKPGNYTVTLITTNPENRLDTIKKSILVKANPVADFGVTANATDINYNIHFIDFSSISTKSWHWDFGDGFTSNTREPDHAFTKAGTYQVKLIASNAYCSDTASMKIIVNTTLNSSIPVAAGTVSVYLNSVSTLLVTNTTNSSHKFGVLSIYDLNGQERMKKSLTGSQNEVTISNLPVGVYFYKFLSADNQCLTQGKFKRQ